MEKLAKYGCLYPLGFLIGAVVLYFIVMSIVFRVVPPEEYYDNFWYCKMTFKTDKTRYYIGDSILLTLTITPEEAKPKKIRFYEDFRNFRLTMTHPNNVDIQLRDISVARDGIREYVITRQQPYVHVFTAYVTEVKPTGEIMIRVPEVGRAFTVDKGKGGFRFLKFHGHCLPIDGSWGDSREDFVYPVEIAILDSTIVDPYNLTRAAATMDTAAVAR